jgi:hypothetical protein
MTEPTGSGEATESGRGAPGGSQADYSAGIHDPLDPETDTIYDALSVCEGPWILRDSETGEEVAVTRGQLAQLLADCRRMAEGDNPLTAD